MDMQDNKDGYWVEAGGRVEKLLDRYNGCPIPSIYAKDLLKNNDVEETGDGYHYRWKIKDEILTKKIYGCKDEEFFNMIDHKIQEEMDYENKMDNLEGVVNESLSDNEKTQSAIFIIGRISESLNEYGYDSITHKTYSDLCQSIKLLQQMQNHIDDRRINNFIELGEDIIGRYPILTHNKWQYVGSDGSEQDGLSLRAIIRRHIGERFNGWYWTEVDGKLETLFKKYNGHPIPSFMVPEILERKDITIVDESHYSRPIGTEKEENVKIMFGFKDLDTYNMVNNSLEGYQDFWERINNQSFTHEGRIKPKYPHEVEMAIWVINCVSDLCQDMLTNTITKFMREQLVIAHEVLLNVEDKTQQINACIDECEYIIEEYEVMAVHQIIM